MLESGRRISNMLHALAAMAGSEGPRTQDDSYCAQIAWMGSICIGLALRDGARSGPRSVDVGDGVVGIVGMAVAKPINVGAASAQSLSAEPTAA